MVRPRARLASAALLASTVVCAGLLGVVPPSLFGNAQVDTRDIAARRAALQQQLDDLEQKIEAQQRILQEKQRERVSLERDVSILDAKIEKARLAIQARDIAIRQLTQEIGQRQSTIGDLNEKLLREKESLAQLLRKTNEIDDVSMVEIILSKKSLADFFEDLDSYQAVKSALKDSFDEIETTKDDTQAEKEALERKRSEEMELRQLQELEAQRIEEQEAEKERILAATKGEERQYQQLISVNEKTAAEIRAELFALRDSKAIPFGEALELAQFASSKTGVRPALILGVLTQETKLGEFLGTGNWQADMHPTRDRPLFEAITSTLGLDPNSVPVSKQPGYGWGGAMGPAQFIPSTWACFGGYVNVNTGDCANTSGSMSREQFFAGPWRYEQSRDRIRALTGKASPSNPWNNQDAFMASALLLKDNGADRGGYEAERLAALRYFAGWANADNPSYAFYGDAVMEHAAGYQRQIEILEQAG